MCGTNSAPALLNSPSATRSNISALALRSLARGGRRWVCLGRADCPAAVRSVHFGEGAGAYDSGKAVSLGILYHSFDYTAGEPRYFNCIMESGVIRYSAQELFTLPELANKR